MEGFWVWCSSVIKGEDDRYHMFASRWPKVYTMHPGWIFKSEVVRAVSDRPEGPYVFQEVVLPERGAGYWDGRATHNPSIIQCGDTYVLFYTGITTPFVNLTPENTISEDEKYIVAQSNKRIGIATSKSIFGPWDRKDTPILPTRPGKFDSFQTSNPAPCINNDGSVLLVYKARRYMENRMGPMTLGVAYAEHYAGPYSIRSEEPIFPIDKHGQIEDPFIWHSHEGYHMIAKDMEGNICGEKYAGVYAYSKDGFHWELIKKGKAYSRNICWSDGKITTMGCFERPFILFENITATHIFAATADGPGGFGNAKNTWNMVVPLKC